MSLLNEAALVTVLTDRPIPEDLWPLTYIITIAVVVGFVFSVEMTAWGRIRKLLIEAAVSTVVAIVFVAPGAQLYWMAWNITVALSYNVELTYALLLGVTFGTIGPAIYLMSRRRRVKG